jgi:hypothetical protein
LRGKRRKKRKLDEEEKINTAEIKRQKRRPTTGSPAINRRRLSGGRKEGLSFNPILSPPDRSNQETLRQKQCLEK